MRRECPSRGGRCRIPLKHLPASPAGEPHQVALGAALSEPLVRERVTELVGVKVIEAGLLRPAARHLTDPARCQRAA